MAIQIDYITSWSTRLTSRLYEQFKSGANWAKLVALLARQAQALEDSAQSLFTLASINDSVGTQLDVIGGIVGQPRLGISDAAYRLRLQGRVAANRSSGSPEDLYNMIRSLTGTPAGGLRHVITRSPPKAFQFHVNVVLTPTQAQTAVSFIHDAKSAGTRAVFEWQEAANASMFAYDSGGAGYDVGLYGGAAQA
jgi:hypothetical protein